MAAESDVFRHFYSEIEAVLDPAAVARLLWQGGVLTDAQLDEAEHESTSLAQRKSDIMSAVRKVIRGDSRKIWVLVAALEKFPASCLIARRMREELINGINEFHDYKMLFYMYNTARVQPAAHSTTTTSPATPGIYFNVMQYKHHVAISL